MADEKKRILIIEDEKPMAHALELKLQHEGFEVESALNGEEGIKLLETSNFDLILCDLMMPKLDGFGVMATMKQYHITTPIIVLSNLSQEDDEKKALHLGAREFFIKSNTPIADIVERVKAVFS